MKFPQLHLPLFWCYLFLHQFYCVVHICLVVCPLFQVVCESHHSFQLGWAVVQLIRLVYSWWKSIISISWSIHLDLSLFLIIKCIPKVNSIPLPSFLLSFLPILSDFKFHVLFPSRGSHLWWKIFSLMGIFILEDWKNPLYFWLRPHCFSLSKWIKTLNRFSTNLGIWNGRCRD